MPRHVLVSFGDSRLQPSARRLAHQARTVGWYDRVLIADEHWLAPAFRTRHRDRLVPGSRGFGYWVWKPQVILQAMAGLDEGDIIHYVDLGCHLRPAGRPRLEQYITMAQDTEAGVVAFYIGWQASLRSYENMRPPWPFADGRWCKGDLLDHLGVRYRPDIVNTPQVEGGHFLLRTGAPAHALLMQWAAVPAADFSLIDDTPSRSPNLEGFVEHRHDQAIFSLLCKTHGARLLPTEHYPGARTAQGLPDWSALAHMPVQARRDKRLTLPSRIRQAAGNAVRILAHTFSSLARPRTPRPGDQP